MRKPKPNDENAPWRFIGKNVPNIEIMGPHSNQYKILVQDIDGDLIVLLPKEAKRLVKRLTKALEIVSSKRLAQTKLRAVK
jgi:hypothetical protein